MAALKRDGMAWHRHLARRRCGGIIMAAAGVAASVAARWQQRVGARGGSEMLHLRSSRLRGSSQRWRSGSGGSGSKRQAAALGQRRLWRRQRLPAAQRSKQISAKKHHEINRRGGITKKRGGRSKRRQSWRRRKRRQKSNAAKRSSRWRKHRIYQQSSINRGGGISSSTMAGAAGIARAGGVAGGKSRHRRGGSKRGETSAAHALGGIESVIGIGGSENLSRGGIGRHRGVARIMAAAKNVKWRKAAASNWQASQSIRRGEMAAAQRHRAAKKLAWRNRNTAASNRRGRRQHLLNGIGSASASRHQRGFISTPG